MATAIVVAETKWISKGIASIQWSFTTTDLGTGNALNAPHLPDKTVHVEGPTGGTTRVLIEGSNATSPTGVYRPLTDPQGNTLAFTSATQGIEAILENPRYIRPQITAATGPTVDVTIVARSGLRG